jgi:hypothetical protein
MALILIICLIWESARSSCSQSLHDFMAGMLALDESAEKVESLTIIGGFDKTGTAEQLTLRCGQVR